MTTPSTIDPGFTTPGMAEIWTAAGRTAAMLEFESALALALAEVGVAPDEEAAAVAAACGQPLVDPEATLASAWETGSPVIALVDEVRSRLSEEQSPWLHYGVTSQDVIDTAQMLQAGKALGLLEESLIRIAGSLLGLVEAHRRQPQMGRTFLQHAVPTTFGMRAAQWLEATLRHLEGLRSAQRGLAVQLGGPVGNRAALGPRSDEVVAAVARRLGLEPTLTAWHGDRSRIWTVVEAVEAPTRSMAKVATDIALLAQTEVGEVETRAGGSSSIPGKRNPLDAIHALAAADACRGAAVMITQARPQELDRGVGSWHVEWFALPLVFHTAAAALQATERLLSSLTLNEEAMGARVEVSSQADQAALDPQIDKVVSLYRRIVGQ